MHQALLKGRLYVPVGASHCAHLNSGGALVPQAVLFDTCRHSRWADKMPQPLALSDSLKNSMTSFAHLHCSSMTGESACFVAEHKRTCCRCLSIFCSYQDPGHTCDILEALWPDSRQPDEGTQALHQTVACDGCVGWRQGSHRHRVRRWPQPMV